MFLDFFNKQNNLELRKFALKKFLKKFPLSKGEASANLIFHGSTSSRFSTILYRFVLACKM